MSNVFNNELHQAIKEVYTELEATQLTQKNLQKAAKLALYNAHGATEKAGNKLHNDQTTSNDTGTQLKEATDATEVCGNIVTAANAASTDARNTKSFASTAAVNIQAAADSLTDLSADTAAILAVATAKDYGSKIQHLAKLASDLTQTAAEKAENTTLQSLNTTIEAAQSRAAVSLAQSKVLKTDIDTLQKTLDQNFDALQTKISADSTALSAAIATENEQDGVYETALQEENAMVTSEKFINTTVNNDLKYNKIGTYGEQFSISFNAFEEKRLMLEKGVPVPKNALKEYRIIFTSIDDAPGFDIHAAKATEYFTTVPIKDEEISIPIIGKIDLGIQVPTYNVYFKTAEYETKDDQRVLPVNVPPPHQYEAIDYTGQALKRGTPYVAFIYVVYTCDFQSEMDDTDGFLSLASLRFTLLTDLPAAEKPFLYFYKYKSDSSDSCTTSDAMRVSFTVNNLMYHKTDLSKIADFRVILFNQENEVANQINGLTNEQLAILFTLDENYRLAEQSYLDAEQAYNTALATGSKDVPALKIAKNKAEKKYKKLADEYNTEQDIIDLINEAKISNFFLDRDILKSIPVAFGQDSIIVTKAFLKELLGKLNLKRAEKDGFNLEIDRLKKDIIDDGKTIVKKETKIGELNKKVSKGKKDLETLRKNLLTDERLEEYVELLIFLLKLEHIDDILKVIAEKVEKALQATVVEAITKVFNKMAEIVELELGIKNTENEIKAIVQNIESNETLILELMILIKNLDKEISLLENELEELSSGADTTSLEATNKQIEAKKEELDKLQKEGASAQKIKNVQKEIATLEKQANAELEKLETEIDQAAAASGTKKFVAINEDGDFTDNYGEPLISTFTYTALVYSLIKSTEPEAIPLFRTAYSPFSKGVVFDLSQV